MRQLLLLSYEKSLYILDKTPQSVMFYKYFPLDWDLPFISLTVSFKEQ